MPHYVHYKIHNFDENSIDKNSGEFTQSTWSKIWEEEILSPELGIMYSGHLKDDGVLCADNIKEFCQEADPLCTKAKSIFHVENR